MHNSPTEPALRLVHYSRILLLIEQLFGVVDFSRATLGPMVGMMPKDIVLRLPPKR